MKKLIPLVLIAGGMLCMWHIYNNFKTNETTAVVKAGEYVDVIHTDALVIREEKPITANSSGFFQNSVPNCSKVEKGRAVGEFYAGTPDKEVVGKINAINEKIRETQASAGNDELFSNDIVTIDRKIEEYTRQISALSAEGKQSEINKLRKNIDTLLDRRANIEAGTVGGKNSMVQALEGQKSELEAKLGRNVSTMYSACSGIFVASADGLENTLTPTAAMELGTDAIAEMIDRRQYEPSEDVLPYPVAKVVNNSQWYIAFVTDEQHAEKLAQLGRVSVKFPGGGAEEISCSYVSETEASDGKKAVFLRGTRELEYLLKNRCVSVEIYVDDYEGLEIPAKALKKHQGKDAVDVRSGKDVITKTVEVLFSNDDIAIVREDNTKENSLLLYEEVVTP